MLSPEPVPVAFPPTRRIWGLGPTIGFSAAIITTYFAAQIIISLIIFAFRFLSSGLGLEEALKKLATDGFTASIAIIGSVLLGTVLVTVFVHLKGDISFAEYVGFKKPSWRTILLSLGVFIVMLALITFISNLAGDQGDSEFSVELYRSSIFPPLLWLAVVFVAPFFEELFFRGFLFVGLRTSRLGVIVTIVLTSLLWAALHLQYNVAGMSQILLMGFVLGTVRHKTDNLWSTFLIHILWNGAAMAATALYVSQNPG